MPNVKQKLLTRVAAFTRLAAIMSNPSYVVYVFSTNAAEVATTAVATPAERIWMNSPKFEVDPTNRLLAPRQPLVSDCKISICGRRECTGCGGATHSIQAASVDYSIFAAVVASNPDPTKGIIIVLTSTVASAITSADLASILETAETASAGRLDLFYFAKWLDRPDQFDVLAELPAGGKIVRTWSPNGIQALAITPKGYKTLVEAYHPDRNPVVCRSFSLVLNTLVSRGELYAATTTPSCLQYDATLVSIRSSDGTAAAPFSYLKACEVRAATHPERPIPRRVSADLSLFWVAIIIVVATICIWFLIKIGTIVKN